MKGAGAGVELGFIKRMKRFAVASALLFSTSAAHGKMASGSISASGKPFMHLDRFARRQFNNPEYTGTQINFSEEEFEKRVNAIWESGAVALVDGYAPFCKHLFIDNFANVECGYAKLTQENTPLMESCYDARKEGELAVLIQYFDRKKVPPPLATHLDIILYSREQIIQENLDMGEMPPDTDAPWGIISVKGQLCDYELPMQPITIMRNALGRAEGGSGVPLDRAKYSESVDFWKKHCAIK